MTGGSSSHQKSRMRSSASFSGRQRCRARGGVGRRKLLASLILLAKGRLYQAAADEMFVSVNMIRNYVRTIYEKFLHEEQKRSQKAPGKVSFRDRFGICATTSVLVPPSRPPSSLWRPSSANAHRSLRPNHQPGPHPGWSPVFNASRPSKRSTMWRRTDGSHCWSVSNPPWSSPRPPQIGHPMTTLPMYSVRCFPVPLSSPAGTPLMTRFG